MAKPREMPFKYPCPKCGAKGGETCKNEAGQVIRGVHRERWPKDEDVNQAAFRVVRESTES